MGIIPGEAGQSNLLDEGQGLVDPLLFAHPFHFEAEGDIVEDVHPGEQAMFLENQCAPEPSVQGLIRKGDVSRRRFDQPRDQFEKGCLSAPTGTYDADPFMAPSREGDILDGGDGAVSGLIDLAHSLAGQLHDLS